MLGLLCSGLVIFFLVTSGNNLPREEGCQFLQVVVSSWKER